MESKNPSEKKALSRSQLKYERERRGWSLAYVATQVNCPDPHMIGRWERGVISPSPRYRQALCELFGKDAEELGFLSKELGTPRGRTSLQPVPKPGEGPVVVHQHSSLHLVGGDATSGDRASLPAQLTSFVGREQEILTICELLGRPEVRLLTLTGTGGVGKTRLGLQAVAQLTNDFADGVRFLSLMETDTPDLVVPTIANKLGLQEVRGEQTFDLLKAFLKDKHLLILLDNFEQVIEAAPILPDLLGCCPHLKFLITSRTVLRVSGEYEFFVSPLALPDLTPFFGKEHFSQYSAIALFLARARTVLPDFIMDETNACVIADICIHLDGLPLAIELAVSRLKLLSPQMLLERLDHRLEILTNGVRDAPVRQQTLRNTLMWSYHLLNPIEQRLFCYLSIFVGGCIFQTIETMWATLESEQEKGQVLEGVASLLDKSMLLRTAQEEGEEPRLFMLRTIREFGLERLFLDGKLEQTQLAHARYYLALAEEAEPALKGSQPLPWLERLEREHDNLHEALRYLIMYGERGVSVGTEMALRLGKALERFWIIRGHVREGRDLIERALKHCQGVFPSVRGDAMHTIANLAGLQGDLPSVAASGEETLALFQELGDPAGIVRSLCKLGSVAQMRGEYATACTYYEESLVISRREKCKETLGETLYYFASMSFFQGDICQARAMIEECLALFRESDDQYNIAAALSLLGWILLLQGDAQAAYALEEENLAICREVGSQHRSAHALSALGHIAFHMGDFSQAYERFEESLAMMMRLGDRWMVAFCLEGLARAVVAQGEAVWAVHLLSAATVLRDVIGVSTSPLEQLVREQTLSTIHDQLDEQAFTTAWTEGQTMSPEQATFARRSFMPSSADRAAEKLPATSMRTSCALTTGLTRREQEILYLVAQGLTDAQVAERLVITRRTVNWYLTKIYRKIHVSSRNAATRYALEHKLT